MEKLTKEQFNIEAKKLADDYEVERKRIEKEAKENGTWSSFGLDSNRHLFKDATKKLFEKLEELKARTIDD